MFDWDGKQVTVVHDRRLNEGDAREIGQESGNNYFEYSTDDGMTVTVRYFTTDRWPIDANYVIVDVFDQPNNRYYIRVVEELLDIDDAESVYEGLKDIIDVKAARDEANLWHKSGMVKKKEESEPAPVPGTEAPEEWYFGKTIREIGKKLSGVPPEEPPKKLIAGHFRKLPSGKLKWVRAHYKTEKEPDDYLTACIVCGRPLPQELLGYCPFCQQEQ